MSEQSPRGDEARGAEVEVPDMPLLDAEVFVELGRLSREEEELERRAMWLRSWADIHQAMALAVESAVDVSEDSQTKLANLHREIVEIYEQERETLSWRGPDKGMIRESDGEAGDKEMAER